MIFLCSGRVLHLFSCILFRSPFPFTTFSAFDVLFSGNVILRRIDVSAQLVLVAGRAHRFSKGKKSSALHVLLNPVLVSLLPPFNGVGAAG